MIRSVENLAAVSGDFDCAVLDQWGVLHDGSTLYPGVVDCLKWLKLAGKRVVVLSNSGKRAALNRERIESIGVPPGLIDDVVTSGEVLWSDLFHRRIEAINESGPAVFFVARDSGDPVQWIRGLSNITIAASLESAGAIVFLGTPDGLEAFHYDDMLQQARQRDLLLICANPDKASPRKTGPVLSSGFFAERYESMRGRTLVFGKPHQAVFEAVKKKMPSMMADRFLMVGDSLEHDVAGAARAGMKSLFVRGGLLADEFRGSTDSAAIERRVIELSETHCPGFMPDYTLEFLN